MEMKKFFKRFACALLVACMILPAGCGNGSKGDEKDGRTIDKNTVYKEELINLNLPKGAQINQLSGGLKKLYISGYTYDETTYESKNFWASTNIDGSNTEIHNIDENGWVDRVEGLKNGNLLLTYSSYYEDDSDPENYIWEEHYYVCILDEAGNEINRIDLMEECQVSWLNEVVELSDGRIMLVVDREVLFLDEKGNIVNRKKGSDSDVYYSYYPLADGRVLLSYWGEESEEFAYLNTDTMEKGESVELAPNISHFSILPGNKDYDLILSGSTSLYGYNIGDTEIHEIMNYVNSDINTSYFSSIISLEDGTFIGVYYDWTNEKDPVKVGRYTKVDPDSIPDKKILTLGCLYISEEIRAEVIKFNKKSDDKRISVIDYSLYNTDEDYEAGKKKLNADISSGKSPDIIVASDPSTIHNYISKGLFVDLTKYMEEDVDIDKDDIFPNLLEAISYKGKVCEVVPYFYISTAIAKKSLVGDRTSWTYDDYKEFEKKLPEGTSMFGHVTRDDIFYSMFSCNSEEFMNLEEVKCNFDSEEFMKFLDIVKDFEPYSDDFWSNYDWEKERNAYRDGKTVLMSYTISDISDYKYEKENAFGEDISFIGFPCKEGAGSALYYYNSYAISSKCKDKDAAWDFIKYFYTDEYQDTLSWGIPALMSKYDERGEEACKPRETPDYEEAVVYDLYYENDYPQITPEEVAYLKDFIMTVTKSESYLTDVTNIINEEAEAFYEGQKTAEEVVKIIQSRASIYLNEKN